MAKKIKFESFVYRLLSEAEQAGRRLPPADRQRWEEFIHNLNFSYEKGMARVSWAGPHAGEGAWPLDEAEFYVRGDTDRHAQRQHERGFDAAADAVQEHNRLYFRRVLGDIAQRAGASSEPEAGGRLATEEGFHDAWASNADVNAIDVTRSNEVCTAPEMRYIRARLGDLRGKKFLDVGCGLGEAGVYFALQGAEVTAMDLSQGMLNATTRLAARYGVKVRTHQSAAEKLLLPADEKFDVIYAGNLLHHVDIERTVRLLKPHLAADGLMVTWDPLAYNPVINLYRRIATDVRTPDEHPLRWSDIRMLRRIFPKVETRYFWLTTLVIFVVMALVQRRNPNKERFWKVVVDEGEKWRWLYRPLELFDRFVLAVLPPLRLLCWNVVIISHAGPGAAAQGRASAPGSNER